MDDSFRPSSGLDAKEEEEILRFDIIEQLWRLWKEYIDTMLVGNRDLKRVFFHVFLGTVLTHRGYRYIESGKKRSVRLHTFVIQDSGTGKTVAMKATHDIIKALDVPARWTIKDNESALTGTVYRDEKTGKNMKRSGALAKLLLLTFDEGSVLLKSSAYMDIVTDVLQGVMDEPGTVSKGMRLGIIGYPSNCTIVGGSYMFNEFKKTMMQKGFLQRMFLIANSFNEQEKKDIRSGVNLLKERIDIIKTENIIEAIKLTLARIPPPKDNVVFFNAEDVRKFNNDLENVYEGYISKQFLGEKQMVIETFFNRFHLLTDRIAAHRAIVNGKAIVQYDDMCYALDLCKIHLKALHALFEFLEQGNLLTSGDIRGQVIVGIIKNHGGSMTRDDLLKEIYDLRRQGKWDIGSVRTDNFLKDLVMKNIIYDKVASGGGSNKIVYIK